MKSLTVPGQVDVEAPGHPPLGFPTNVVIGELVVTRIVAVMVLDSMSEAVKVFKMKFT